jgi:hypothetical protein
MLRPSDLKSDRHLLSLQLSLSDFRSESLNMHYHYNLAYQTSGLKVSTFIITSITTQPIRLQVWRFQHSLSLQLSLSDFRSEGLNIHYHYNSAYQTCCHTNNHVCHSLHNCFYSACTINLLSYQMTFLNKGSNVICLNCLTLENKVMVHTLTNSNSTTTP